MQFVFLPTDAVLWAILIALCLAVRHVRRTPELAQKWRRVFARPSANASAAILAALLVIAALDSIHYREALPEVAPDSLHLLREYPFAGNARELRNVVERAAVLRRNRDVLTSADLNRALHPEDIEEVPPPLLPAAPAPFPPEAAYGTMPDSEKDRLFEARRACGGNRTQAARRLGIDRTTLWRKLQKYIEK